MEEVPASPEVVKERKSRRKAANFKRRTRLSLHREKSIAEQESIGAESLLQDTTEVEEVVEQQVVQAEAPTDANLIYFDVNTAQIELADEDPFAFASILERANEIELNHPVVASEDFLINVKNRFVKIDDVIEPEEQVVEAEPIPRSKTETVSSSSKKANYSYTQFDLDTQMLGICEAADIIAGLNSNPDHELKDWSSPLKQEEVKSESQSRGIPEHSVLEKPRKDRWSDVRQSSFSRKNCVTFRECKTPPSAKQTDCKRLITVDFSDDSDTELTVDYSKIECSQLRQRLTKIQSYIDSPPQLVKKTSARRTFSKKKPTVNSPKAPFVIRRLSYESNDSDKSNDPKMEPNQSSSDEELECLDGSQLIPCLNKPPPSSSSPVGDDFDSSLLIKANINQLSQFFSQSAESQVKPKRDSESLVREPSFHGFPPEPSTPISLASEGNGSLQTISIDWLFRTDSESESEEKLDGTETDVPLHRLLDDDDEFLVQLNPLQKTDFKSDFDTVVCVKESTPLVKDHNVKSSLLVSAAINRLNPSNFSKCGDSRMSESLQCDANQVTFAMPAYGGFQTARGNSIKISGTALQKARAILSEEDKKLHADESWKNVINEETSAMASGVEASSIAGYSGSLKAGANGVLVKASENQGETCAMESDDNAPPIIECRTAGQSSTTMSKSFLANDKCDKVIQNSESASTLNSNFSFPNFGGFQTANGDKIKVSEEALQKAHAIWSEDKEILDSDDVFKKPNEEKRAISDGEFATPFVNISTACGHSMPVSSSAAERPLKEIAEPPGFEGVSFAGFSTAGGSSIAVSKGAIQKAKAYWREYENEVSDAKPQEVVRTDGGIQEHPNEDKMLLAEDQPCVGFRTALGTRVNISDVASAKAHSILQQVEIELACKTTVEPTACLGFQTARGSAIKISESALAKAQSLLQQVEQETNDENEKSNVNASAMKRPREFDSDPETPLKKSKLNGITRTMNNFSTSTPNLPSNQPITMKQKTNDADEINHFFGDLDDKDFQHLFCSTEAVPSSSRRARPLKQVRLTSRFEEFDKTSPTQPILSGGTHWDDSFGDVMAKLSSDAAGRLIVAQQILDARKLARQRQMEYASSKPESELRPRLTEFVRKKQQKNRASVQQFVGYSKPSAYDGDVPGQSRWLTAENVADFKFDMVSLYGKDHCLQNIEGILLGDLETNVHLLLSDNCEVGLAEFSSAFLATPGIDPALVPPGWIENAWKWILIKLSCMERNLSSHFPMITTPENVFNQLLYRYHLEIDYTKRSVIRKILEKDEVSGKRMVLFVSRVFRGQNLFEAEIELCDGWYPIRTILDYPLTQFVLSGKIGIGTKLMIQGAEILNLNEGCAPLEVPSDVRLKIHANSTRRAQWSTKLGLYKIPLNFLISCNDILDRGGLIARLHVVIVRVYPMMFVDKSQKDALGTVLRSERVERRRNLENDANKFDNIQALFSQVKKELDAESVPRMVRNLRSKLTKSASTAELLELVDAGVDLSCFEIELTATQRDIIAEHQRQKHEECLQEINRRVKDRMSTQTGKRKVAPLLKVRVMDARKPEKILLLSVWRPPVDLSEILFERNVLEIQNASANSSRNGEIQLTTGKNSVYQPLNRLQCDLPVYQFRKLTKISEVEFINFRPPFNEFDTIGIVVHVGSLEAKKFQMVYLADLDSNLLCVNFWSGIKEYAYDDVVKERSVLCISNLQWRTINALNVIPNSFATEYTTFSEHSKAEHFKEELLTFHSSLSALDQESFYNECNFKIAELKDKKLMRSSSLNTPIRSHHSLSTSNCTTPMRSVLSSVNLTATTPTDFSPGVGQPVSLQKRKIQRLAAAYKSPPKLTPITLRSNPHLRKGFKTPARLGDRIEKAD